MQQEVLRRQLQHAIRLGKPITIHTREAEEDTERILKEVVPREHKVHGFRYQIDCKLTSFEAPHPLLHGFA